MGDGDWRRFATVPPVNNRDSAKLSTLVPRIRNESGALARQFEAAGSPDVNSSS